MVYVEKFSVYPAGAQGIGLLALLLSLALAVIPQSLSSPLLIVPQVLLLVAGAMLVIGGFVRTAAILAALLTMIPSATIDLSGAGCWLAVLAVGTLGPGAYSLDGGPFGRRVIRIDRQKLPPPRDIHR